jgi:beta-glucosidase/6-phospho-beta-glucosidase/beta-galactosidase
MAKKFEYITGFESTLIHGTGLDVAETSRHLDVYKEDFALLKKDGIKLIRYPILWHRIEKFKGEYDWALTDELMAELKKENIEIIADPLHHTSFPEWLEHGFASQDFPIRYHDFVVALVKRYPQIRKITLINEPSVTALFCGGAKTWYPYSEDVFEHIVVNMATACCTLFETLEKIRPLEYYHVDVCERHVALDEASKEFVQWNDDKRFMFADLILGRIDDSHPLWGYLTKHGFTPETAEWFRHHPARIDVYCLDYYSHSELEWKNNVRVYPATKPVGFKTVALEYQRRYNLPIMLSETNIRGFVEDRITWLKFMVEECERLAGECDFRGFCWFPYVDSTDWDSLVTKANGNVDPQGIYYSDAGVHWRDDKRKIRHASELSEIYSKLAKHQITSKDIPAYKFQPPLNDLLHGFIPLMKWKWSDPPS